MRRIYLVVLLLPIVGCGGSPTKPSAETASMFLSFTSTPGDELAHGQTRRFESPQATFFGAMSDNNRAFIVTVRHDGTFSQLSLRAQAGQVLTPGVYRNASAFLNPFLVFSYSGSSCDRSSGEFEVLEAVYGPNPTGFAGYSGTIQRFRATFRQSCGA